MQPSASGNSICHRKRPLPESSRAKRRQQTNERTQSSQLQGQGVTRAGHCLTRGIVAHSRHQGRHGRCTQARAGRASLGCGQGWRGRRGSAGAPQEEMGGSPPAPLSSTTDLPPHPDPSQNRQGEPRISPQGPLGRTERGAGEVCVRSQRSPGNSSCVRTEETQRLQTADTTAGLEHRYKGLSVAQAKAPRPNAGAQVQLPGN